MIKIVTKNNLILNLIHRYKIFRSLFVYDITNISSIKNKNLYNSVISSYSNSNNTSKFTYSGRFDDLNNILNDLFLNSPVFNNNIQIHDVAISTGVTTVELYKWLKSQNYNFEILGSDKFSEVRYHGNKIKYFYDVNDELIQVYFYKIFCGLKISNIYFISKLLFFVFKKSVPSNSNILKFNLFDKEFSDLIVSSKIKFLNFDLFDSNTINEKFDFIRVMNVLNLIYFSEAQIQFAINKLKQNLNNGGFILIGRTDSSGVNNATFYKLDENNNLRTEKIINQGYEFNYLVISK